MESAQAINNVTGVEDEPCLYASEVMEENPVLFEFIRPDGERMSVRLDGKCDGGPDGVVVLNYALPLWFAMASVATKKAQRMSMVNQIIDKAIAKTLKKSAGAIEGMFTASREAEIRTPRNPEG